MAEFIHRLPQNVPGRFYVDDQCLDCDLCRETAPNNFTRVDEHGVSYIFAQPTTPEDVALCLEAADGCCVEAIGTDGEQRDWTIPPVARYGWKSERQKGCCHDEPCDNENPSA